MKNLCIAIEYVNQRAIRDIYFAGGIVNIAGSAHRRAYGYRRITAELYRRGIQENYKRAL